MEKELQIPSFVNDNYKKYHKEQEEIKKVKRINFYKKTCRSVLIAAALAGGVLVLTKTPMVGKLANAIVEYDNQKYQEHQDAINEEIYENTGRTISEQMYILEHPNLTSEEVIEAEKKTNSYH